MSEESKFPDKKSTANKNKRLKKNNANAEEED